MEHFAHLSLLFFSNRCEVFLKGIITPVFFQLFSPSFSCTCIMSKLYGVPSVTPLPPTQKNSLILAFFLSMIAVGFFFTFSLKYRSNFLPLPSPLFSHWDIYSEFCPVVHALAPGLCFPANFTPQWFHLFPFPLCRASIVQKRIIYFQDEGSLTKRMCEKGGFLLLTRDE